MILAIGSTPYENFCQPSSALLLSRTTKSQPMTYLKTPQLPIYASRTICQSLRSVNTRQPGTRMFPTPTVALAGFPTGVARPELPLVH